MKTVTVSFASGAALRVARLIEQKRRAPTISQRAAIENESTACALARASDTHKNSTLPYVACVKSKRLDNEKR